MSVEYDTEIRKTAQSFAETEANLQAAEKRLEDAKREYDAAKFKRDEFKRTLATYVGRSERRRVIKLVGGSVVLISYENENNVSVEIHSVL